MEKLENGLMNMQIKIKLKMDKELMNMNTHGGQYIGGYHIGSIECMSNIS